MLCGGVITIPRLRPVKPALAGDSPWNWVRGNFIADVHDSFTVSLLMAKGTERDSRTDLSQIILKLYIHCNTVPLHVLLCGVALLSNV